MFTIARRALELMSGRVGGFKKAAAQPHKFCRGFGIFQFDLQHFRVDPAYFLEQRYLSFAASLEKALVELHAALKRNKLANRESLTDLELCSVAIAYNKGSFDPQRGLKQGHFDGERFYGEHIFDFLRLAQSVPLAGVPAPLLTPPPGAAALPPPTPLDAEGAVFEVDVRDSPLRLRSAPVKNDTNIIARLPDGQRVQSVAAKAVKGFLEVETSLNGAHLRGFAAREFLVPLSTGDRGARARAGRGTAHLRCGGGIHAAASRHRDAAHRSCRRAHAERTEPARARRHDARGAAARDRRDRRAPRRRSRQRTSATSRATA